MVDANISKRIFDKTKKEDWQARIYSLIGRLYYRKNSIDSAQYYFNWALKKIDQAPLTKDQKVILESEIRHDLANTYDPDNPEKFIENINLSDSLYQILNSQFDKARLRIDLGQFYLNQGQYEKADSLFQLSLDYGVKNSDDDILIKSYQQRGYLSALKYYYYKKEEHSQAALRDFKKCLSLQEEGRYQTYEYMGWLHYVRWDKLENIPDMDSTLLYSKLAIEEASKEGAMGAVKSVSHNIVNLCEFENEWNKCRQILNATPVTFLNDNYQAAVDTITHLSKAAYQRTNQVEQREIVVSATRNRQNLILLAAGALIIAGLIFLLILQQLQQKRLQARMEALRAQINPHFFFNSLNAIESLVNLDRKKEASKYLIHFSRLSRQILNRSRDPNTTLKEELRMMKHFLELEKLRFKDKLSYEIDISPDLNPEQIEVPGLILQPYAENAILHGIKPKEEGGVLRIGVKKEGSKLVCVIEDDGIGRKKSSEIKAALAEKRKSMGMDITKERIQKMGKVKGQSLEIIDLIDDQGEALGTRVILRLPLKYIKE